MKYNQFEIQNVLDKVAYIQLRSSEMTKLSLRHTGTMYGNGSKCACLKEYVKKLEFYVKPNQPVYKKTQEIRSLVKFYIKKAYVNTRSKVVKKGDVTR